MTKTTSEDYHRRSQASHLSIAFEPKQSMFARSARVVRSIRLHSTMAESKRPIEDAMRIKVNLDTILKDFLHANHVLFSLRMSSPQALSSFTMTPTVTLIMPQ